MEPYRFTTQENQFTGECLPCTKAKFYTTANSASVNNTITTRQAIEKAIDEGQPLDNWINCANFRDFCQKQASRPRAGESFAALAVEQKLQQWTNSQKMWLPCFVFSLPPFPRPTSRVIRCLTQREKRFFFVVVYRAVSWN